MGIILLCSTIVEEWLTTFYQFLSDFAIGFWEFSKNFNFHIRACLIPSMASFRGCLKKSDMPTCGTEK